MCFTACVGSSVTLCYVHAHTYCSTLSYGVGQSTPGCVRSVFNPSTHRLSFLASVITLCARYMLDLPDKARQDYCHLCTRYSYSRQSLSLTQCVCTCILPAHGLFGLSNIPTAPLHICCHEPPSGPQTLHAFPISLNHFLCQRPHSTQTCTPQAFYLC